MIFGLMVVRNEVDRYLASSVSWLAALVDDVLVFDDMSTDNSKGVASAAGARIAMRLNTCPSFLEDESQFRQTSWAALGHAFKPTTDDWVVVCDADEFVIANGGGGTVAEALRTAIDRADEEGYDRIDLPVAEVFALDGTRPLVRTDGEWGKIRAVCACRYQRNAHFMNRTIGCGRIPDIASPVLRMNDPVILHVGYLREKDRTAKAQRYGNLGVHNRAHIDSILKPGTHEPWALPIPEQIVEALTC